MKPGRIVAECPILGKNQEATPMAPNGSVQAK